MQTLNPKNLFFSIYQSRRAIEIRLGCDDYPELRIISTSRSYQAAYQVARVAAESRNVPLENYVPAEIVEQASQVAC